MPTKRSKTKCETCENSGFVTVGVEDGRTECVPCWSCDLGFKIEKLETEAEKDGALSDPG